MVEQALLRKRFHQSRKNCIESNAIRIDFPKILFLPLLRFLICPFNKCVEWDTRCLWRLPTSSGVSQRFCQWKKFVLIYRVSQKKAVKSKPEIFLRKCNFIFFNVRNCPIFTGFETFFSSNSSLLIFGIESMFPQNSQILVDYLRKEKVQNQQKSLIF